MSDGTVESIGQYLLKRLYEAGVKHIFGVPGDYILGFYDLMMKSQVQHIGTTREDAAGFAADGYARCSGMGALAVTYGVGALSTVNAVAGAYAESSPVVVISGAPGVGEQIGDPLLHHRFGPFTFQQEIFQRITCASVVLSDPVIAFRQIDSALNAARQHCKPVYIEIPRDRVLTPGYPLPGNTLEFFKTDATALSEAVTETLALLAKSKSPVLIAGVELHRRGLQVAVQELVNKLHLQVAATLSGKSVIAERHPAYLGIYEGAMSDDAIRQPVEQADLVIMLGASLNDIDSGGYTTKINPHTSIRAAQNEVIISAHRYTRVALEDYLQALLAEISSTASSFPYTVPTPVTLNFPEEGSRITSSRLISRLNQALSSDMLVVADVGDCMFAAIELQVHEQSEFLASSFYTSMGFAVPAALGAQIARPDKRALILVGDGAFQMTGTELSTHAYYGLNPIVIVFNNHGYSTERYILEGQFNEINLWRFHRLGELFGPLEGYEADTETAFEEALTAALANITMPSIINVQLAKDDASSALKRLAEHLKSKV